MEDIEIVELYLNRDEKAIFETQNKYGNYCFSIAYNILSDREDSKECVNDTYLHTWDAIPPHKPTILSTFIGKITRRLAIDKYRKNTSIKRGGSNYDLSIEELNECIASNIDTNKQIEVEELTNLINNFLASLKVNERRIFVCRYYYFDSIRDIANRFSYSESKVKMSLLRTREKLKDYLLKEGYEL